jgi:hypothetical protein
MSTPFASAARDLVAAAWMVKGVDVLLAGAAGPTFDLAAPLS